MVITAFQRISTRLNKNNASIGLQISSKPLSEKPLAKSDPTLSLNPKNIQIADFNYALPDSLIAKYPLPERDQSKLLIYRDKRIETTTFVNLPNHLPINTFLVFNNTKVVSARLVFENKNGSKIEIFCLEPDNRFSDITNAMLQKGTIRWKCLVGGAKKWKEGLLMKKITNSDSTEMTLTAKKISH